MPLSNDDKIHLALVRRETFRHEFWLPAATEISLEAERLIIDCDSPEFVDLLGEEIELLRHRAYIMFGARELAIEFKGELIWWVNTTRLDPIEQIELESKSFPRPEAKDMPATLTKPVEAPQPTAQVRIVYSVDDVVTQVAAQTGQPEAEVRGAIEQFAPEILALGQIRLIPASTLGALMQRWAEAMADNLAKSLSNGSPSTTKAPGPNGKTPAKTQPKATAAKPQTAAKSKSGGSKPAAKPQTAAPPQTAA